VIAVLTPTGRRRFWPWAGAMAVAGVLYLPWLVYSRKMAEGLGDSHWYIPEAGAHAVFKVLRSALISPFPLVTAPTGSVHPGLGHWLPHWLAYTLVTIPPVLALLVTLPLMTDRSARGFVSRLCWAAWLAPVVAVTLVSFKQSLLLPRYFVFLGPFVAVLFAQGVARMRPLALRLVFGASLVALSLLGLMRYTHDFTKEPWDDVTAHLRRVAAPGHTVVLVPFDVDPLKYYLRDGRSNLIPVEVVHPDEPFSAHFTPRELDEVDAETRRVVAGVDEVWVIIRSANNPDRWALASRTLGVAAEGRTLAEHRVWPSYNAPLFVSRYVRADSAAAPAR
jgi:hypothetical protein